MLSEKLQFFRVVDNEATFELTSDNVTLELGNLLPAIYRLDTISMRQAEINDENTFVPQGDPVEIIERDRREIVYSESNPLTKATVTRPVFVREGNTQIRNLEAEFNYYDITWLRFQVDLPVKPVEEPDKEENDG